MKKVLLSALLLCGGLAAQAQFQHSFTNPFGNSCDHYSVETAPDGATYAYAYTGTYYTGSSNDLHVFTTDAFGNLIWEEYITMPGNDIKGLDVAIDANYNIAVTGMVGNASNSRLYAALYDQSGAMLNDFMYVAAGYNCNVGNAIYYSEIHDQYVIGGFASDAFSITSGQAVFLALDGAFNFAWANHYTAICDDFEMAVINEIIEVNDNYFITGNLSASGNPANGQSQVLAALIESTAGNVVDNASFAATNTLGGQQAMGVSAHFDEGSQRLVLLYNVSVSPTVDENRPYLAIYEVAGSSLIFNQGYRIFDTFSSNPPMFSSNPSFTSCKLLPNQNNGTYVIFGLVEHYGQFDDAVISVYQEIDLNSGSLVTSAKYWDQSYIANNYPNGYPGQGGFFSSLNPLTLNSDAYTPETTTLDQGGSNFVSILPSRGNSASNFSYEIISSTLNTASASSGCIESFEMELVDHAPYMDLCLVEDTPTYSTGAPGLVSAPTVSSQTTTCIINMMPEFTDVDSPEGDAISNAISVYANPVADILTYSIVQTGNYQLIVVSVDGKEMVRENIQNAGGQKQLNVSDFEAGVYILTVIDQNGQSIKKQFVKK